MATPPWAHTPLGTHPPQTHTPRQTPPGRHPQADTSPGRHPSGQTLPLCRHPPCPVHTGIHTPPLQCMLGYSQQAGGTHPTGMYTCFTKFSR